MAGTNPPSKFKDFAELADFAQKMNDIDAMVKFVKEENEVLNEPLGEEDLNRLLNGISKNIRQRADTYDPKRLDAILEKIKVPEAKEDRLELAVTFAIDNLVKYDTAEAEIYIITHVKKHFDITQDACKTIFRAFKEKQHTYKQKERGNSVKESEDSTGDEDRLNEYPGEIRELAFKILNEGDSLKFILDTWNLRHVGDKNIGENCLCAVASTYILNTRGLHVKPSGESGKGKSDAIETVLKLLPEHKYISGSMSSKSLYYHPNLNPGTIIYSDDANFTEDTIATLKQSTSNFQAHTKHRTVVNQEYGEYSIPERCSFWFSTIDGIPDEQLANRFLNADVDGSSEQDKRVYTHIKESELSLNLPVDDDVLICRCIFDILGKELYNIKIPYINAIEWTNIENRRNFPKFLDILRSITFFNLHQRQNVNGYYLSDIEDFDRALEIYKGTSKNNATNLTDLEIKVLKYIEEKGPVTIKQLMKYLEKSRVRVMQILNGKDGKGGMFAKVQQLNKIDQSKTAGGKEEDKTITRENMYEYNGPKLGFEVYTTVAKIDTVKATEEKEMFIKRLTEESVTTVTQCNPGVTSSMVTLKTYTVNRINSNVTLKRNNAIQGNCDTIINVDIEPQENDVKNNIVSHSEKAGYRVTLEGKTGQSKAINKCNPENKNEVTLGYSGYTSEKTNIYECVKLLKKALIKYANDVYKKPILNVAEFVDSFNRDIPAYSQRLGYNRVLEEAQKLKEWGRI